MASTYTQNQQLVKPTPGDPASQNTWGSLLDTDWDLVDTITSATLSLSVAGSSNVILTSLQGQADQSRYTHYELTGVLTGNITVFWPTSLGRKFSVVNLTTGAYTLTLASNNGGGAAAGTTVTVTQGTLVQCVTDGSNMAAIGVGVPVATSQAGCTGNGTSDDTLTFFALDTAVGSAGTILVNQPIRISNVGGATRTISSQIVFVAPGAFVPDSGVTLNYTTVPRVETGSRLNTGLGATVIPNTTSSFYGQTATPQMFGARGDGRQWFDGAITNGSHVLSSANTFVTADIGKTFVFLGAGVAGADLITTIASVPGGVAHLTAAASTTVASGGTYWYGTDDTAAFTAWAAASYGKCASLPAVGPTLSAGGGVGYGYILSQADGVTFNGNTDVYFEHGAQIFHSGAGSGLIYNSGGAGIASKLSGLRVWGTSAGAKGIYLDSNSGNITLQSPFVSSYTSGIGLAAYQNQNTLVLAMDINDSLTPVSLITDTTPSYNENTWFVAIGGRIINSARVTSAAFVKIPTGNNISFSNIFFRCNSGTTTIGVDIGNENLASSVGPAENINISMCQFEGPFGRSVRSGYGTYASGTSPRGITVNLNQVNGQYTLGAVYDFKNTTNLIIVGTVWPTFSAGGYNYIIDSTCDNVTIIDPSSNSAFASVSTSIAHITQLLAGGVVTPTISFGPTGSDLSNYTETNSAGAFVPTLAFGGASTGITYGHSYGVATRIGRLVFFQIDMLLTSKGSATGAASIGGLPYTINSGNGSKAAGGQVTDYGNISAAGPIFGIATAGGTTLALESNAGAGSAVNVTDVQFANTSSFLMNGWYVV